MKLVVVTSFSVVLVFSGCGDERIPDEADGSSLGSLGMDTTGTSSTGASTATPIFDMGDGVETGVPGGGDGPIRTCEDAVEAASNLGCTFWAVDLPNVWAGINGSPSPQEQQFSVVVANSVGDVPANVELFRGSEAVPLLAAQVEIGGMHTFELQSRSIEPRANTYDSTAFRIESDVPITAYQFNPLDNTTLVYSNDASLLFPEHVLGRDYTAVTGDAVTLNTDQDPMGDNAGAFVSVVATRDDTVVDLFPTWTLYPGAYQKVSLQRGQVFTAISVGTGGTSGNGNLSGSRVRADRPVAVFSGNVATIEPHPGKCCADHLEHQMLPMDAWGDAYFAAPPPSPKSSGTNNRAAYRITGAFDGTALVYSPSRPSGAPESIDAYQTIRFETDQPFSVTSTDATKPFAVTQFLLSNQAVSLTGEPGDPAMIALPALEQLQNSYMFLVPHGYTTNFVTVIRPAAASVALDGSSVSEAFKALATVDGRMYEYAHVKIQPGAHYIEGDDTLAIVVVGYAKDVSYGYPGGSGVAAITMPPPPPVG